MAPRGKRKLLSVVVPCYDEETVIAETHRRLAEVVDAIPEMSAELIYVDDGSRDGTRELLRVIQRADERVRVVALSRNFGHQLAVTAGVDHAAGDAVVLIDADLQDPPEVIVQMVERWRAGADVVYGVRTERAGESTFKRGTAKAF
jgi:polyisoprenyl-phosphate glycosyltransferase